MFQILKFKFEFKFLIAYLLIGGLWILSSDWFVQNLFTDVDILTTAQTYKGWFYVLITGILFYVLLNKHLIKIRKAEKKARESDFLKTAFLQNISHEIRTPMNAIVGFSDLLQEDNVSREKQEKYLKILANSSDQLLKVVNDVLDVSMIETDNVKVNLTDFSLRELFSQIQSNHTTIAKESVPIKYKNTLFENDYLVYSDKIRIEQVLDNLISNAIKFTFEGAISFGCEIKEDKLLFFVKDSGIGIDSENQEKIFDRFHRAEVETTKTIGGTGLGLAICKGNVDLLGGEIWVDSELGKGSEFYFTIPCRYKKLQLNSELIANVIG